MQALPLCQVVRWEPVHLLAWPREQLISPPEPLSGRERAQFVGVPRSRRADWSAGRSLARRLVSRAFDLAPEAIDVLAAASGAPVIHVAGRPAKVAVSLSHAGGWVVAAVCGAGTVGVDVCPLDQAPRVRRTARLVFSQLERERLGGLVRPEDAASAWALAEAGAKAAAGPDGRVSFWGPTARPEINHLTKAVISDGSSALWSLPGAVLAVVHVPSLDRLRLRARIDS
jgi:phosphopantetheinyl transferase